MIQSEAQLGHTPQSGIGPLSESSPPRDISSRATPRVPGEHAVADFQQERSVEYAQVWQSSQGTKPAPGPVLEGHDVDLEAGRAKTARLVTQPQVQPRRTLAHGDGHPCSFPDKLDLCGMLQSFPDALAACPHHGHLVFPNRQQREGARPAWDRVETTAIRTDAAAKRRGTE